MAPWLRLVVDKSDLKMLMIAKTGQIIPVLQESKNLMPGSKTSYLIIKKRNNLKYFEIISRLE